MWTERLQYTRKEKLEGQWNEMNIYDDGCQGAMNEMKEMEDKIVCGLRPVVF